MMLTSKLLLVAGEVQPPLFHISHLSASHADTITQSMTGLVLRC